MRSELEQRLGKIGNGGKPCGCFEPDCLVCTVFGTHANTRHNLGPPRIIVRDCQLTNNSESAIEIKSSTAMNRNTGGPQDGSLRSEERVLGDFTLRIGIQIWDLDSTAEHKNHKEIVQSGPLALVAFVLDGLKLVQRTGLGSGVSKGSGEIEFIDLKLNGQAVPEDLW